MSHRRPEITLSADDRRLLLLLARLLSDDQATGANFNASDEIVLSDREAFELIELLEAFSSSSRFIDGSYFVETLFGEKGPDDSTREIYLKWRKRNGRTRALASTHWQEFLVRLGLSKNYAGYMGGNTLIQARRMDISQFLTLERVLLESSELSPRVRALLLRLIAAKANSIERIRNGEERLTPSSISKLPQILTDALQESRRSMIGMRPMGTQKVAGVMTIVIDMSAIFTTRDWNVVGTLSSMAGALVAASERS